MLESFDRYIKDMIAIMLGVMTGLSIFVLINTYSTAYANTYSTQDTKSAEVSLGAILVSVSEDATQIYGIPSGLYVKNPYDNKTLLYGDVITKANDTQITSESDLNDVLLECKAGDSVNIEFYRLKKGEYVKEDSEMKLIEGDLSKDFLLPSINYSNSFNDSVNEMKDNFDSFISQKETQSNDNFFEDSKNFLDDWSAYIEGK